MPSDLEVNVRTALENLAKALADATELTVETRYKPVAALNQNNNLDDAFLAARTVIQLDGDHAAVVPVTITQGGAIQVEDALLDLHMRNVQAATEYREKVLNTLVDLVRRR